jgi:hypothetical protein
MCKSHIYKYIYTGLAWAGLTWAGVGWLARAGLAWAGLVPLRPQTTKFSVEEQLFLYGPKTLILA